MTLALYVLGVALCWGIARYNESNKLFWTLFTAWTLGYAVTTMVVRSTEQSESNGVQVSPTQDATLPSPASFYMLLADTTDAPKKETSKPVSQALTPAETVEGFASANVTVTSRDQPVIHVLANPPTPFNTS